MRTSPPPQSEQVMAEADRFRIGYCANVHPGRSLDEVKSNLETYSVKIKESIRKSLNESLEVREPLASDQKLGVGLWLSATTLNQLQTESDVSAFDFWLAERGLRPFTINGFPYGDFHQEVVKHDVYLPTWADPKRLEYTLRLAEIQRGLSLEDSHTSISTLPIGWPSKDDEATKIAAAENLRQCANRLNESRQENGHVTRIAIEPEPGCILDTAEDVVDFFQSYLLTGNSRQDGITLEHITVCHDVCHSAVMFESQRHAIESYKNHGIKIGKVQVSSAVEVDFTELNNDETKAAFSQLKEFNEPKYLHQTSVREAVAAKPRFFEDLSIAIADADDSPSGIWRVHFHVPIFAESLNALGTTQQQIKECVEAIGEDVTDFEIETYAWNVLPESQRGEGWPGPAGLIDGISRELSWFHQMLGCR